MLGSLAYNRLTVVSIGILVMAFMVAGNPAHATTDSLEEAIGPVRDFQSELESLSQRHDAINERFQKLDSSQSDLSSDTKEMPFFASDNPTLWFAWITIVILILLLISIRRRLSYHIVHSGSVRSEVKYPVRFDRTEVDAGLVEPVKVVKIKVRKLKSQKKPNAQKI